LGKSIIYPEVLVHHVESMKSRKIWFIFVWDDLWVRVGIYFLCFIPYCDHSKQKWPIFALYVVCQSVERTWAPAGHSLSFVWFGSVHTSNYKKQRPFHQPVNMNRTKNSKLKFIGNRKNIFVCHLLNSTERG
jgi:hypothetical protein